MAILPFNRPRQSPGPAARPDINMEADRMRGSARFVDHGFLSANTCSVGFDRHSERSEAIQA